MFPVFLRLFFQMLAEKCEKKSQEISGKFARFSMRCVLRIEVKNTAVELAESLPVEGIRENLRRGSRHFLRASIVHGSRFRPGSIFHHGQILGKNYGFNFKDANIICVAQNGDPEAVELESNENMHIMKCNFKANDYYPIPSNFISCVYQFVPHKDWSIINPNSIFCCKCRSKDMSIQKVTIEFKCGDNLFKFYENTFTVGNEYTDIEIPITYEIMPKKHLKDISEICFVVRPNFAQGFIGEIEIGGLKFQDNIITNM